MSDLRQMQLQLTNAMLATASPPLDELCSDPIADGASRFAIYHRGYRLRLRDALATEFPGLALLAGRRFPELLDSYTQAHPSTHYNIRWHGQDLAQHLAEVPPWRERPVLAEMARLDWAISTAFDATDEALVDPTELARLPADAWAGLRLRPLGHAQLVVCLSNIDAFRRAADRGASRPALRRLRRPRHLLVWRPGLDVRYRPVGAAERLALEGVWRGETFAQLCERLAHRYGAPRALPRMASLLHRWLADGLISHLSIPTTTPV
ncbi:DNA-binding domain-containing protein [Dyella solisilvae]|nr:DNA-binding domain-containing protein [Dyella solisilvae]